MGDHRRGIGDFNIEQAGPDAHQSLCFVLRAPDQEIAGGVIGATHWDWLHVDLRWVKEALRGQGYGHRRWCRPKTKPGNAGPKMPIWRPTASRPPSFIHSMATGCWASYQISLAVTSAIT